MKPMMSYLGGKSRFSGKLKSPQRDIVIEPFAGGAGYSLRYEPREVILIDKNPIVASTWAYLISVSEREIRSLPIIFDTVDDIDCCQEAKWLIGFWLGYCLYAPRKTRNNWSKNRRVDGVRKYSTWTEHLRERIASQLCKIRHWKIIEGDYSAAPDVEAHWLIDPPYIRTGKNYPTHELNYDDLSEWCKSRRGYTLVHEEEGAEWLPFKTFVHHRSNQNRMISEVIWENET